MSAGRPAWAILAHASGGRYSVPRSSFSPGASVGRPRFLGVLGSSMPCIVVPQKNRLRFLFGATIIEPSTHQPGPQMHSTTYRRQAKQIEAEMALRKRAKDGLVSDEKMRNGFTAADRRVAEEQEASALFRAFLAEEI